MYIHYIVQLIMLISNNEFIIKYLQICKCIHLILHSQSLFFITSFKPCQKYMSLREMNGEQQQ